MPVSLEVTFAAYLAVLLGTFVPVTFLIVLYAQVRNRVFLFIVANRDTNLPFSHLFFFFLPFPQSEARKKA